MAATATQIRLSSAASLAGARLSAATATASTPSVVRFTPRAEAAAGAALSFPAPSPFRPSFDAPTYRGSVSFPVHSKPPTPVFPSSHAMATFLQSYGRMLQHVQTAATAAAGDGHAGDAIVSGDALAAAGATVVERVRLGLMALVGHPVHGVAGGAAWCAKERAVERCLAELEADIESIRSAHERPPRAASLVLASAHCFEAARLIRSL